MLFKLLKFLLQYHLSTFMAKTINLTLTTFLAKCRYRTVPRFHVLLIHVCIDAYEGRIVFSQGYSCMSI